MGWNFGRPAASILFFLFIFFSFIFSFCPLCGVEVVPGLQDRSQKENFQLSKLEAGSRQQTAEGFN